MRRLRSALAGAVLTSPVVPQLVAAQNGLAHVSWAVGGGISQTAAEVTLTAPGQSDITTTVSEATDALFEDVESIDPDGNPIQWSAHVEVAESGGRMHIAEPLVFTPTVAKPSATLTGIPTGAPGDPRAAATLTPITAGAFQTMVQNGQPGAVYENFDVSAGVTLFQGGATFKRCRIPGHVATNGGGVSRAATFIDCEVNAPLGAAEVVQTSGPVPYRFVRCDLSGAGDVCDAGNNFTGAGGIALLHTYMHDPVFGNNIHCDIFQLSDAATDGIARTGNAGRMVGCFLFGREVNRVLGINSCIQLGSNWQPGDRVSLLSDWCWFDAPDCPSYALHGNAPSGNQQGDITIRNGFIGLGTGASGLIYPQFKNLLGWENMRWETSGVTADGRTVIAGDLVPLA